MVYIGDSVITCGRVDANVGSVSVGKSAMSIARASRVARCLQVLGGVFMT